MLAYSPSYHTDHTSNANLPPEKESDRRRNCLRSQACKRSKCRVRGVTTKMSISWQPAILEVTTHWFINFWQFAFGLHGNHAKLSQIIRNEKSPPNSTLDLTAIATKTPLYGNYAPAAGSNSSSCREIRTRKYYNTL